MNHRFAYACECGDPTCRVRLRLTYAEYDRLRERGSVLAPDHAPRRVLERCERYAVVAAN